MVKKAFSEALGGWLPKKSASTMPLTWKAPASGAVNRSPKRELRALIVARPWLAPNVSLGARPAFPARSVKLCEESVMAMLWNSVPSDL